MPKCYNILKRYIVLAIALFGARVHYALKYASIWGSFTCFSSMYLALTTNVCMVHDIKSNVINGMAKFVGGMISGLRNWSGN